MFDGAPYRPGLPGRVEPGVSDGVFSPIDRALSKLRRELDGTPILFWPAVVVKGRTRIGLLIM